MKVPTTNEDTEGPNLTPMIDVLFLLLIFFIVATQFAEEEKELETQLAEVAEAQPLSSPPQELVVNVMQDGEYRVSGKTFSEAQLQQLIHQQALANPHQSVQIRTDERTPFKFPARVMGICQQERIKPRCSVKAVN
jgi:biopolymer transport protein ExbD